MSLVEHAEREFEAKGWPGDCEMQGRVCENILELLKVFFSQGHSGTSAPYVLGLFNKLAKFEPISPLTGEDDEWNVVAEEDGEPLYQNKRDREVFKKNGAGFWIHGRIFIDKEGCSYTSKDSWVPISFPWARPEPEIVTKG